MAIAEQGPRYLDASAITKLIAPEVGSTELLVAVADGRPLVSSELVVAEVPRAVRGIAVEGRLEDVDTALSELEALLGGFALVPIGREVLTVAAGFGPHALRTLDAIHVATSLLVEDVHEFVSYDRRQLRAADEAGLATASPGWS